MEDLEENCSGQSSQPASSRKSSNDSTASTSTPTTITIFKLNCVVCGAPSKNQNLGAMICRACAAFYKRSIIENLTFQCHEYGNCDLKMYNNRNGCKACRVIQCKKAGAFVTEKAIKQKAKTGQVIAVENYILSKLKVGFEDYVNCEKRLFNSYHLSNVEISSNTSSPIYVSQIRSRCVPMVFQILDYSCPPFKLLPPQAKKKVISKSYIHFIFYMQLYVTIQNYSDPDDVRIILGGGYTVNLESCQHEWVVNSISDKYMAECYIKAIKPFFLNLSQIILEFKTLKITDYDTICLLMLVILKNGEQQEPHHMSFYKDLLLKEWSTYTYNRLGKDGVDHITQLMLLHQKIDALLTQQLQFYIALNATGKYPPKLKEMDLENTMRTLKIK